MGTVMLVLKNIILDTVYSALKINGNSGRPVYSGLHLAKNNQKANKQVNSDDTEGEEERDCAQKVCKRDLSWRLLHTNLQRQQVVSLLVRGGQGVFLNTDILGNT